MILAGTVATASVVVGNHVAVMPGVILTHDDVIDDYATITSGVRLGGGVHVGTGAYLGAGILVRENVTIGPWAMIGMGSVVTHDVPAGELWLGTPARYLRAAPVAAEVLADTVARMNDAAIPLVDLAAQHAEGRVDRADRVGRDPRGDVVHQRPRGPGLRSGVRRLLRQSSTASVSPTVPTRSSSRCRAVRHRTGSTRSSSPRTASWRRPSRSRASARRPCSSTAIRAYQLVDAEQVADRMTARTRAIVPVHLYGQMADMGALEEIVGARDRRRA